jgi:hypothetical protein
MMQANWVAGEFETVLKGHGFSRANKCNQVEGL